MALPSENVRCFNKDRLPGVSHLLPERPLVQHLRPSLVTPINPLSPTTHITLSASTPAPVTTTPIPCNPDTVTATLTVKSTVTSLNTAPLSQPTSMPSPHYNSPQFSTIELVKENEHLREKILPLSSERQFNIHQSIQFDTLLFQYTYEVFSAETQDFLSNSNIPTSATLHDVTQPTCLTLNQSRTIPIIQKK
ncbi:hypothetical protein J6590_050317 [Homalodisca vitripennis]|nr:hypothetical protein J6590_050317 [Homalodisca vitripennis]